MATKISKPIGGAAKKGSSTSHIMVPVPMATRKKIESLAKQEQRSMAYLCRQFIEQGLNNVKKKPASK